MYHCSSQLSSPSVHGLMALCALGVLSKDTSLTLAVMEELLKQDKGHMTANIAKLYLLYYSVIEVHVHLWIYFFVSRILRSLNSDAKNSDNCSFCTCTEMTFRAQH